MLRPAREGTGIIAGGGVRAVLGIAGVKNVLSKSLGPNNQLSVVSATLDGLSQLRTASRAQIRGETVCGPAFTQVQPKENVSLRLRQDKPSYFIIMKESNLPKGSNREKKRLGRGEGNGHGKTCCRGHKGAGARSGYSLAPRF